MKTNFQFIVIVLVLLFLGSGSFVTDVSPKTDEF